MRDIYGARSPRDSADARIALVAAKQHGVISRAQALDAGITRRMVQTRVDAGRWARAARDVFAIAGAPRSWRQDLMVAVLAWGAGAVVSHRAAAALWRLPPFEQPAVEVTVPRGRRRTKAPGRAHEASLARADITMLDGIPVTTPARTLLDLAAVASRDYVEEALDAALRRGLTSLPRLRRYLQRHAVPGRTGVVTMRALLEQRAPTSAVPQSVFETRLLRALRQARIPTPRTQHPIRRAGRLIAVVDFAYVTEQLAIEADGYEWHSGRARFERDRARRNALTLLGWHVIHVTWRDLAARPDAVVAQIRAALTGAR